jgi:hypothetical protein
LQKATRRKGERAKGRLGEFVIGEGSRVLNVSEFQSLRVSEFQGYAVQGSKVQDSAFRIQDVGYFAFFIGLIKLFIYI